MKGKQISAYTYNDHAVERSPHSNRKTTDVRKSKFADINKADKQKKKLRPRRKINKKAYSHLLLVVA